MIEIFIYGCDCGVHRPHVNRIKDWARRDGRELKIYNTKRDVQSRVRHLSYLDELYGPSEYDPIVVVGGSFKVKLSEFKT